MHGSGAGRGGASRATLPADTPFRRPASGPAGRWLCAVEPGSGAGLQLFSDGGPASPLLARAGAVTVVFAGSLADRGLVTGEAGQAGGDADAILAAYRSSGDDLFRRLSGTFALVVWDAERERLLCARDATGLHPLHYARTGGSVVLSPFVEPLVRRQGASVAVDPVVAALRILGYPSDPGETLFTGVHTIPPGHALEVTASAARVFRYWDPGEPGGMEGMTTRGASERFEALLLGAAGRVVDSGPAAVFLSGGIDSALVAAAVAEASREKGLPPPLALSLMVDHPDLDEEASQRAVAHDLGLDVVAVSIGEAAGAGGLLAATLAVSASGSAGPADIIQPVYDHLAREALRRGRHVVANGQGGDEWLLPPVAYAADRLRVLDVPSLYRLWRAWYQYVPFDSHPATARLLLWTWGARPVVRAAAVRVSAAVRGVRGRLVRDALERVPAWLCPEPALRRELGERLVASGTPGVRWREHCRTSRRQRLDRPGRPGVIEEAFATHARLGARIGMPLLDAEVVGFLNGLPPGLLVHGGRAKALARDVVAGRLPSFGGRWPRTVSGDRYYGELIRREARGAWRTAGGTPCLADVGVVDGPGLARLLESGSSPQRLWSATNLDVWLRATVGAELPAALATR